MAQFMLQYKISYFNGGKFMNPTEIDREYHHYLDKFQKDAELGALLNRITYQELFNEKFLHEFSKFKSLDEMLARSGFGIVNLGEVEKVNQDKWNSYIAANTKGLAWFQFGKLAMIEWMKTVIKLLAEAKKKNIKLDLK
jgi:hypothetical protein